MTASTPGPPDRGARPDRARSTLPADRNPAHGSLAHRGGGDDLQQPHDRDERVGGPATQGRDGGEPDPLMQRAAQDLAEGQVDTDLRSTPGLDAPRREGLVEGGGHGAGRPPGLG